jgi:hypothetical protein
VVTVAKKDLDALRVEAENGAHLHPATALTLLDALTAAETERDLLREALRWIAMNSLDAAPYAYAALTKIDGGE